MASPAVLEVLPSVSAYEPYIEAALKFSGGTHDYHDIIQGITEGRFQFWPGVESCVVTELVVYPKYKAVNIFLAAGRLTELELMVPLIAVWAKKEGCSKAQITGREGWKRTFVTALGFTQVAVMYEAPIN